VQDDQLAALENWATMNMHKPDVAKWELACQDWKALPDSCNRQQYREFCSKHGLPQRDRRDGKAYKNALRQSLIEVANRKRATIDAYFDSPSSK
jgi:protoheme ferro-lyase